MGRWLHGFRLIVIGIVLLVRWRGRKTAVPAGYGGVVSPAGMESHVGGWQPGGMPVTAIGSIWPGDGSMSPPPGSTGSDIWQGVGTPGPPPPASAGIADSWSQTTPAPVAPPAPTPAPTPAEANAHLAGWYPSPQDPRRRAWWDGTDWSNNQVWDGTTWRDA
jgi:hypothetical protein